MLPRIPTWLPLLLALAVGGASAPGQGGPASAPAPRYAADKYPMTRALAALYKRPERGAEPRIRFAKESLEFGEVAQGADAKAAFSFVNDGAGPLAILAVRPHCGCTVGTIEVAGKPYELGAPIAPKAAGKLEVLFRANTVEGERDLDVDVLTNDPSRGATPGAEFGEVVLHLTAQIVRFFEWEGGTALDFGRFQTSAPQAKTVILTTTKKAPFEVLGVDGTGTGVEAAASPESPEKTRWRIEVTTKGKLPLGLLTRRLHVKTRGDSPMASQGADLFVTGTVRGSVDSLPPLGLRFLVVPRGTAKSLTLTLVNESGKPWSVGNPRWVDPQSAALDPPEKWRPIPKTVTDHVTVEKNIVNADRQIDFNVTIGKSMPAGAFSMVLAIDTGLDDGPPTLLVPAMGVVR